MSQRQSDSESIFARWSRLSLRSKGVAVLAVPMAALFTTLIAIYWTELGAHDADQTVMQAYETRDAALRLQVSLEAALSAAGGNRANARGAGPPGYDPLVLVQQFAAKLVSLGAKDPASAAALQEVRQSTELASTILGKLQRGEVPAAQQVASLDRGKQAVADAEQRLIALQRARDVALRRATEARDSARARLFRIVMVCGMVGPLGALLVHLVLAGRLVRRLHMVEENAWRMANGLPFEAFDQGSDEIADLAHRLEEAANLLRGRERELRESERRFRDLFDQAPIPYEETDLDGSVRRYNQAVCNLLKCEPERIMGCLAWDFVAPDQQDEFRAAMMERLARGVETGPFECDFMLQDGSRIAVEIRETFIRSEDGKVTGVCRSLMDVTERNLAALAARKVKEYALELSSKNEQLARALNAARSATEAKSRFLAGISHELRTPLNGIIGFSELMHDGKVGPVSPDHREFLGDILTSARHLLLLINDILDLSKVEAGKMEFQPELQSVDALVQEVRDVIRPLADKKRIQLTTEVPADLCAWIDASRFKQVLYNYLSNAVKFTPSGGRVMLRVTLEEGRRFRLDVEDTGIGIEPSEIGRLFQEFQQLPNSRSAEQGTGLGLALTRHIVEAQGGKVAVRSQLGKGSVFSAVLPLDGADGVISAVS
ncbi:MAG TPA: ATP-binding protein [Bryobacteraceae bacterium]|nr:ATP-binding protein [Bryobacteraceae bacterium]